MYTTIDRIAPIVQAKNDLHHKKKNQRKSKLDAKVKNKHRLPTSPGYYIIYSKTGLLFKKLETTQDIADQIALTKGTLIAIRKINKTNYDLWKACSELSTKIEMSPTEILAITEKEIKKANKVKLGEKATLELQKVVEIHAKCNVSLTGIFADIGVSGEITTTIESKHYKYEAKLYAQAKVGVFASPLGVGLSAEAEIGAEQKASIKDISILSYYKIDISATVKGYIKTEGSFAFGYDVNDKKFKSEAKVFAGIGVSIIAAVKLEKDKKEQGQKKSIGILELEGGIKCGFGAGGKFEVTIGVKKEHDKEDDTVYTILEIGVGGDVGAVIAAGYDVKGSLKIPQEDFNALKNKLKGYLTELIYKMLSDKAKAAIEEQKQKLETLQRIAKDEAIDGLRDAYNYFDKGIIFLEGSIGMHHLSLKEELNRQSKKLKTYKKEVEKLKEKLQKDGNAEIQVNSISDKELQIELQALIDSNSKNTDRSIKEKSHIKLFLKYAEKYERRINKINAFLDGEILNHYVTIKASITSIKKSLAPIEPSKLSAAKDKDKIVDLINTKLKTLNKLTKEFNSLTESKEKVVAATITFQKDLNLQEFNFEKQLIKQHKIIKTEIDDLTKIISTYRDFLS